jgi:thioredoxin-like negative regulator of GroEL
MDSFCSGASTRVDGATTHQYMDRALELDAEFDVKTNRAQAYWLEGKADEAQSVLREVVTNANAGDIVALHRELELLISEHPARDDGDVLLSVLPASTTT